MKRPILRWHGGKWILAPWIIEQMPHHKVYVEPFGGAGSVLLRKPRSYAEIYNDLDEEVVNLFKVCRDNGEDLINALNLTPFSRVEFKKSYERSDCQLERARRLVIRSFMGFGSNGHARKTGFRANSNRRGTTPAMDWKNYPSCLSGIIERLRGVVIENKDACDVMRQQDGLDTLHYVDPPYPQETRDNGKDYTFEMSDSDHKSLLETIVDLNGIVIISTYENDLYDSFLRGWTKIKKNSFADGARKREEVLFINRDNPRLL